MAGDYCYRVGEQRIVVDTALVSYPWTHSDGQTEQERVDGNKWNVAAYFAATSTPILQIAAGPNTFPSALPEDILVWNGKTRLWVRRFETDLQPYTAGKKFTSVLVLNPRNPKPGGDYLWVFTVSKSVLDSGTIVTVVGGAANQPGYYWIKHHQAQIESQDFEFLDETTAPPNLRAMPVTGINPISGRIVTTPSQPNAMQIRYRRT